MDKVVNIKKVHAGQYLVDSGSFSMQVSSKLLDSSGPGDWVPVERYVVSRIPYRDAELTSEVIRNGLKNEGLDILVDNSMKSYKVDISCSICHEQPFFSISGSIENY